MIMKNRGGGANECVARMRVVGKCDDDSSSANEYGGVLLARMHVHVFQTFGAP